MFRNESGNRKNLTKLNNAGLSLVEMIIVIAILAVVGGLIAGFLQAGTKNYQSANKEVEIQYDAQVLLNQIGGYVMDANSGLTQSGNTTYIYSRQDDVRTTELLIWEEENKTLYYEKKEKVNGTESTVVEKTILAEDISDFSVDLSEAETKNKVKAELTLQKAEKSYQTKGTWNLRNTVIVSIEDEGGADDNQSEPTVTGVKVTADKTQLWPGEEQIFYAKVYGTNNPSQAVVWFLEGTPTSADTYIDAAGILHLGMDETATDITVAAQSVENVKVTGTLPIQIHDEKIRIAPEEVWLGTAGGAVDPDSYGTNSVDFQAELLGEELPELSSVSWACSTDTYQQDMAEQPKEMEKTLTLTTTQKAGKITVQVTGIDENGNELKSNEVVVHVVTITSNHIIKKEESCLIPNGGTRLYIYGLEDIGEDDLQIAGSFEDIKNNTKNCRFYLYESKELLYLNDINEFGKRENGSWHALVHFFPEFTIWDRLFPNAESQYTCVGIYKAGELPTKIDKQGEACKFGFSVIKIGVREE